MAPATCEATRPSFQWVNDGGTLNSLRAFQEKFCQTEKKRSEMSIIDLLLACTEAARIRHSCQANLVGLTLSRSRFFEVGGLRTFSRTLRNFLLISCKERTSDTVVTELVVYPLGKRGNGKNFTKRRLVNDRVRKGDFRKWGRYLGERSSTTVREDLSVSGEAWNYISQDAACNRSCQNVRYQHE
ncbi:hypothetical protein HG15A2_40890 [Adhaeretor mobilis]|uniref:Uncharacterized protein n=1 Tax=Adhaeretor mobilis TaxID=1930276 RepID=A0A517N0T9_9BACT|nr:hypothetical protein HG15A2_40890 [Adhaeretor mobilis]